MSTYPILIRGLAASIPVCFFHRQRIWPMAYEATPILVSRHCPQMSIRPALEVPLATAQSIVDRVLAGRQVTDVANIHGGEIAAVYMITFEGPYPPVVLKVYPDALHWKMQKEANVISLVRPQLSVPIPRILLADDSKQIMCKPRRESSRSGWDLPMRESSTRI